MDLTYDTFPGLLRAVLPGFARVYDEHVADNDGVLPHVLLGDLVRFLTNEIGEHGANSTAAKNAMSLLERGMNSQDPRVQELVAVSFLENLDPEDPRFPAIRALFGPKLEAQYRNYEEAMAKRNDRE
jgi:hypothetical protein